MNTREGEVETNKEEENGGSGVEISIITIESK